MSSSARVLRFPKRHAKCRLSPQEASALAAEYLEVPVSDRSEDLVETVLSDADVLLSLLALLKGRRDADPAGVAAEAAFAYGRISKRNGVIGLFDERDYVLGEFASLASTAQRFLGNREEAFRWLDRAEAAFRHTVNPGPGMANVAYARLALRYELGRFEDVLELLPSLISSFDRLGMQAEAFKSEILRADALRGCDRLSEARQLLAEICDGKPESVDAGLMGQALFRLGQCAALEGETDSALESYRRAVPLLQTANQRIALASLRAVVAETLRLKGQLGEALESYRSAQSDYAQLEMRTWVAHLGIMISELLLALDRPREAEWEILQALPTIEEQKMVPEGFAAVALLRESVKRRKTDPNALRELREHLQKQN
jgi:tetratricopeptide (TPR) repeat protein